MNKNAILFLIVSFTLILAGCMDDKSSSQNFFSGKFEKLNTSEVTKNYVLTLNALQYFITIQKNSHHKNKTTK